MFRVICPHCGHTRRSAGVWLGTGRCPKCGEPKWAALPGQGAAPPDRGGAKTAEAAPAPARRWPLPFGGPLAQFTFVVVVIVFFAVLAWLVVPPLVAYWSGHAEQIEHQAAPAER